MRNTQSTHSSHLTVRIVRAIGSWGSVVVHTIIFIAWYTLNFDLELLLVAVSIEAIYLGILILVAENQEAIDKERLQAMQHQDDMRIIESDARVDQSTLEQLTTIKQELRELRELITNRHESKKRTKKSERTV